MLEKAERLSIPVYWRSRKLRTPPGMRWSSMWRTDGCLWTIHPTMWSSCGHFTTPFHTFGWISSTHETHSPVFWSYSSDWHCTVNYTGNLVIDWRSQQHNDKHFILSSAIFLLAPWGNCAKRDPQKGHSLLQCNVSSSLLIIQMTSSNTLRIVLLFFLQK